MIISRCRVRISLIGILFNLIFFISAGTAGDILDNLHQDTKHFLRVGIGLAKAPLYWQASDWTYAGVTIGATGGLFFIDKSGRSFALHNQNNLNDHLFRIDRYYGNPNTILLPTAVYLTGWLAGNGKLRHTGLQALEALIYAGGFSAIIKGLLGRRRPYAGDSNLYFKPFHYSDFDYRSLPSGHATVAVTVATVFAHAVDNKIWKIFWYGTAGWVAASRIYHNKHWLSDVFLGSAIGYGIGSFIVNFDTVGKNRSDFLNLQLNPLTNRIGICFSIP